MILGRRKLLKLIGQVTRPFSTHSGDPKAPIGGIWPKGKEAKKSSKVPPVVDQPKEKKTSTPLLFADRAKKESTDWLTMNDLDDVHSSRYKDLNNMRTFSTDAQKKDAHSFFFNRIEEKKIPVYLDDINIVNIDNEETFNRVPTLAHKLDTVV